MSSEAPLRILRDTFSIEDESSWSPHGSGGAWRRRQTDGILRGRGIEPLNMEPPPRASLPSKLLAAATLKARLGNRVCLSRTALASAAYSYAYYRHNTQRHGLSKLITMEWGTDPVAFVALKECGFKIVASIMAINSLWRERPNPVTGPYPRMFHIEIENLRLADAVFCISREEQWLLGNLGIRAHYLPYFPDEEREQSLLAERAARGPAATQPEFLICATRGNTDTVDSFREQVDWIQQAFPENSPIFHVTGQQTEQIRDVWSDPRFVFHGTCPDEEFIAVKRRCCAICLHSQKGLGALTRIPDMLLAGLPVIANAASARSFLDTDGVHVYDTRQELRELLLKDYPTPAAPKRPVELEQEFFASLIALL